MHRRTFLAAVAVGVAPAGCLSRDFDAPSSSPESAARSPAKTRKTETPIRRTADGATATFRVVDGRAPTEDAASATFGDGEVTVEGTADPSGCNRPTLADLRYDAAAGALSLTVGGEPRYETADVECGNASFDYRCAVTVDGGRARTVEVTHDYEGKDDRTFALERG